MRIRKEKDKCVSSLVPGWDRKKHISWHSSHFSQSASQNEEENVILLEITGQTRKEHASLSHGLAWAASVTSAEQHLWITCIPDCDCVCGHPWQVQTVWALGRPQWDPALSFHKSNCLKHRQQTEIDFFSPSCFIPGMIKYLLITYFPMSNSLLPRIKCRWGRWGKRSLFT